MADTGQIERRSEIAIREVVPSALCQTDLSLTAKRFLLLRSPSFSPAKY